MAQRLEEALQLLGIPANSDPGRVAEAYRGLARATHPDVSADPDAAARFATLASAYRLAYASACAEHSARHANEPALPQTCPQVATSPAGSSGSRPIGGPSASSRTAPGRRPPIIAGPVVVRRFEDETSV